MFLGFAIGLCVGLIFRQGGYKVAGVLVVLAFVAVTTYTLGFFPTFFTFDLRFTLVLLVTFASPFLGVWAGTAARRFASPD
jgi:hypothetical protein